MFEVKSFVGVLRKKSRGVGNEMVGDDSLSTIDYVYLRFLQGVW